MRGYTTLRALQLQQRGEGGSVCQESKPLETPLRPLEILTGPEVY
jgi:hypothetical protein